MNRRMVSRAVALIWPRRRRAVLRVTRDHRDELVEVYAITEIIEDVRAVLSDADFMRSIGAADAPNADTRVRTLIAIVVQAVGPTHAGDWSWSAKSAGIAATLGDERRPLRFRAVRLAGQPWTFVIANDQGRWTLRLGLRESWKSQLFAAGFKPFEASDLTRPVARPTP